MATRYANLYGLSDRTSVIAVSGTTSFSVGSASGIVNGTLGNTQFFGGGQTGTYLEFDFGEPILVDEIKWYQDNAATHGVWKWQGYDVGSSSWVDIGSTFTLGGNPQVITAMSGATAYYQKYRLQQVSGATSSSPWIQEIEFKNERAATDANFANVVLLMPFDEVMYDLAYHDRSLSAHTITASAGGTDIEPGQKAYGDRSVIFYGPNNGYLTIPDSPDWDLGGAPFTIEARVYDDNYAFGKLIVGNWGDNSGGQRGWILYVDAGSTGSQGKIAFAAASSGATIGIDLKGASGSIIAGAYRSVCVDYDGTYLRLFVDNVMQAKSAWSGVIAAGTYPLRMGRDNSGSFSGTLMYRQDVRITKGVSLHGSDASYTVVLKPYPEKSSAGPPPTPSLDSVTPDHGVTAGGTSVTLVGTLLTGTTDVQFDGVSATSIVVVDDNTITCDTPAHALGPVDVEIFNPAGNDTLVNGYEYSDAEIISVTPPADLPAGGASVTILGSGFTGATDVKFGANSGTSIVVVDDNHITCIVPAHAAGTVNVQVFTPAGNPILVNGFTYSTTQTVRVTQVPVLILDDSNQKIRLTQLPVLILYQEEQPNRITQVPVLVLYEPKPIPLPKPIIPEVPLYESWNWLTVVNASYKGQEQRARLRETPRYMLEMSALILNDADRVATYNMLMRFLTAKFLYPMFQYNVRLSAASSIGDTKLFLDPALTDVRDGEFVVLYDPHLESFSYLEVTTVDSDGVNLALPLEVDVTVNWEIAPAFKFRILPTVGLNMNAIDGNFSLKMESVEPREFQRPGATPTLTYVDSILVIPQRPLANGSIEENFDFNVTWYDNDTSVPDNLNEWSNPKVSSKVQYMFDRKTGIDYWRAVVDALKGRQGVVLMPTFRNDIPLRDAVALNASTFTTTNIEFLLWWLELTFRYVMIMTANGPKYRAVTNVEPHYDADGNPYYATVTLASSIGNTAGDNDISSISYMNLYRLNNDSVKITHYEIDSMIELDIKAVDK